LAYANDNFKIATTIRPLELIIKDVVGNDAEVFSILSDNYNPHGSMVSMSKVKMLGEAKILFIISKSFDKGAAKFTNVKTVELGLDSRLKIIENFHHKHVHKDEHIWLNPDNAMIIAERVVEEMCKIIPGRTEEFYARLERFRNENLRKVTEFKRNVPKIKNTAFYTFHNEYAYLTDYFGLKPFIDFDTHHHDGMSIDNVRELKALSGNRNACLIISSEHKSLKNIAFLKQNNIKYVFLDSEATKEGNYYQIGYKYAKIMEGIYNSILSCND